MVTGLQSNDKNLANGEETNLNNHHVMMKECVRLNTLWIPYCLMPNHWRKKIKPHNIDFLQRVIEKWDAKSKRNYIEVVISQGNQPMVAGDMRSLNRFSTI
jgi:hypothetical protein